MWPFLSTAAELPSAVTDDLIGARSGVAVRAWQPRDAVAYAVGINAGPQEGLPSTWATVLCQHGVEFPAALGPWPAERVVHVEQSHRLLSPLTARGVLSVRTSVTDLHDRRSGVVVGISAEAVTGDGRLIARTRMGLLLRGAYSGRPAAPHQATSPDPLGEVIHHRTLPDQAERYARCGDDNPLHRDADGRPRLHGLCTYGFAGRALVSVLSPGEPQRLTGLSARFLAPVTAGDTLRTEVHRTPDGAAFRTRTHAGTVVAEGTATLG
jgi:acyl dehydratase